MNDEPAYVKRLRDQICERTAERDAADRSADYWNRRHNERVIEKNKIARERDDLAGEVARLRTALAKARRVDEGAL